jgi:heme oxygenase
VTARAQLREATAAAHQEVDAIFSAFPLGEAEGYRHFLLAQAAAFLPIEAALDASGAGALIPDWQERRRSQLLRQDVTDLGLALPEPIQPPSFDSREALLGGVYVLEGSRLGGALLSRQLPSGLPSAFMAGPSYSARWRKLLEELERLLYRPDQIGAAVEAANHVFSRFALAGRRQLESLHT